MSQQPNYATIHENTYQKLKHEGTTSYNPQELYQNSFQKVHAALQAHNIESGKLLELGCGAGDLSLLLADAGYQTFGIDISDTAITWAKEKSQTQNLNASFVSGSVLDLPHQNDFFDVVIDALCFHCIIGQDRPIFLQNVWRVLKPDGLFIIMTKCGEPTDPNYPFDPITRCKIVDGIATRYWGLPEALVAEIESEGFQITDWKVYKEYKQPLFFAQATKANPS